MPYPNTLKWLSDFDNKYGAPDHLAMMIASTFPRLSSLFARWNGLRLIVEKLLGDHVIDEDQHASFYETWDDIETDVLDNLDTCFTDFRRRGWDTAHVKKAEEIIASLCSLYDELIETIRSIIRK